MQIKSKQDTLLADYAEGCISDVQACLSQNNYNSLTTLTTDEVSAVAVAACRPQITTCMSATGYGTNIADNMYNWLQNTLQVTVSGAYSDPEQITNAQTCAAAYGKWTPTASPKCAKPANAEWKYGVYRCQHEGGVTSDGTLKCCAQGDAYDATRGVCKVNLRFVDIGSKAGCEGFGLTWNDTRKECYVTVDDDKIKGYSGDQVIVYDTGINTEILNKLEQAGEIDCNRATLRM